MGNIKANTEKYTKQSKVAEKSLKKLNDSLAALKALKIYEKLSTETGRKLYAKRKITIEPVYGQIKYNRGITEFMRRGRSAVQSEWRLVAATHNLLKLHSHQLKASMG